MRLTMDQVGDLSVEVERDLMARDLTMQEACYVLATTLAVLMKKILHGESDETKLSEIQKICDSFCDILIHERSADKFQ